jgi:deoxyguanosine kinase
MIVSLEGLPGVGKTTAAGRVALLLQGEPVRETTGEHPFLGQVYEDVIRDDLTVELAFLLVHANAYRRIPRGSRTICDFSPVKDQLFAEDMLSGAELNFFLDAYRFVYQDHPRPDVALYLRADPALCLERVRKRLEHDPGREFELGMTLERLVRMRDRYESALDRLGDKCLVYDLVAARTEEQVAADLATILRPFVSHSASSSQVETNSLERA